MRFSRLFHRATPLVHRDEPVVGGEQRVHANGRVAPAPSSFSSMSSRPSSGESGGPGVVFDLLSVPSDIGNCWSEPDAGAGGSDRLMGSLYAQYCRALESPYALQERQWSGPVVDAPHSLTASARDERERDDEQARGVDAARSSIAEVLGDISRLEEAFGPLPERSDALAAPVAAPEILRLFAPREFEGEAAARRTALPPTLAQREHHTLAIDSPLPVLRTAANDTKQDSE